MKLHELRPAKGSTHKVKRIGRGDGSGHGGTSTKGTKGQQSRTGYKRKMAHEGGQMPIQRRIPKRGFNNPGRIEWSAASPRDRLEGPRGPNLAAMERREQWARPAGRY